jgi:hypothetical protein
MRIHVAVAACALGLLGCSEEPVVCGEDTCAPQQVCAVYEEVCVYPDQLTACQGLAENDPCTYVRTRAGFCYQGLCLPEVCGDGRVVGFEDCDGEDLDRTTCLELGFQEEAGLACDDSCRFDTTACVGFCGDGLVSGPESCDTDDLGGSDCTDFGSEFPEGLRCTAECTYDSSTCF